MLLTSQFRRQMAFLSLVLKFRCAYLARVYIEDHLGETEVKGVTV